MLDVVVWRHHSYHTVETKKILSVPKHVLDRNGCAPAERGVHRFRVLHSQV